MKLRDVIDPDNDYWKNTEAIYQKALQENDKEKIWLCVYRICTALVKKTIAGHALDPDTVEDRIMESTTKCMEYFTNGNIPRKLTSFCYLPVLGVCCGPKARREEQILSFDQFKEEHCDEEEKLSYKIIRRN